MTRCHVTLVVSHVTSYEFTTIKARDETQEKGIVNERITVIIKTFRRYNCLLQIVNSIRKFYPTVTIIIADDRNDSQKKMWFKNTYVHFTLIFH